MTEKDADRMMVSIRQTFLNAKAMIVADVKPGRTKVRSRLDLLYFGSMHYAAEGGCVHA